MHNGVVVEYNLATKCNRLVGAFVQLPSAKEERQKKKKKPKKKSLLPPYCAFRSRQKQMKKNLFYKNMEKEFDQEEYYSPSHFAFNN